MDTFCLVIFCVSPAVEIEWRPPARWVPLHRACMQQSHVIEEITALRREISLLAIIYHCVRGYKFSLKDDVYFILKFARAHTHTHLHTHPCLELK